VTGKPVPPDSVPGAAERLWWQLVAPAGAALGLTSLVLIIGVWFPPAFGTPDWEFGSASGFLDGLPVALIGIALVIAGAMATGRRWLAVSAATLTIVLGLVVVLCALLIAINLPLALRAAPDPVVKIALRKALAKSAVQSIVLSGACLLVALKAFSWAGRFRRP
jgi:hypothetical protein